MPPRLSTGQVRQVRSLRAGGEPISDLASIFSASWVMATIYRALQQGFLDDGATDAHSTEASTRRTRPSSAVRTRPRHRCDSRVTARRRKEIAGMVTVMPHGQRTGLIEALLAFADAAGEPD